MRKPLESGISRSQKLHRDGRQMLLLLLGDLWTCGCCPPVGDVEKRRQKSSFLDAISHSKIWRKKVGLLLLPEAARSGNARSRGLGQSLPVRKEMFPLFLNIYIYI